MSCPKKNIVDEFADGSHDYTFTCKVCGTTITVKADNMQIAAFRGFKKHDEKNPSCRSDKYRLSGGGAVHET